MTANKKMLRPRRLNWVIFALFAFCLIFKGIGALLKGDLGYGNYWGGLVFAPMAIAIGLFSFYIMLFRWRKFSQQPKQLKGRAARRARQAAAYRSTIDDFRKPWSGGS
jgi:hypothetical protein